MLKVIWNSYESTDNIHGHVDVSISNDFKYSLHAVLDDAIYIGISESEKRLLMHKLKRLEKETKFIEKNWNKYDSLTKRERQVMKLLLSGCNNPEIASQLYISRRTVEQHRKNINRKLKTHSAVDFFVFGYAFNMV